jgi:Ca2+/Na+ antiporter
MNEKKIADFKVYKSNNLDYKILIGSIVVLISTIYFLSNQLAIIEIIGFVLFFALLNYFIFSFSKNKKEDAPIFILRDSSLFYSKSNTWYDINQFGFRDIATSKHNIFEDWCMYDKNDNIIFQVRNDDFKNLDELKEQIIKNRIKRN